jgi:hypothetical protein
MVLIKTGGRMKRKHVMAIMSLVVAIGLMSGCSKKPSAPGGAPEAKKVNLFAPAGAGFTVVLPAGVGGMKKETASINTPLGPKNMDMYQAMNESVLYLASETKLTGIKLDLKAAIAGGLRGSSEGGTVIKKEEFEIGGNPALKARFKTQENGKDVFVQYLLTYANETQFQLQVRASAEKALDSPEVKEFINSFKLTGTKPAAAPAEKPAEKPAAGK